MFNKLQVSIVSLMLAVGLWTPSLPLYAQPTVEATPELPPPPAAITHVIVISLDGARPDAIQLAPSPNMEALAAGGAVAWNARTVYPSVTLPAHASMLTGLEISEHGLDDNDSIYPCPVIDAPTFITLAAEAGFQTAMVVGKQQFCRYLQTDLVDYTFALEGDRSVVDRALELLDEGYEVIFLQFPNPDYFGHLTGWMSDTYINEMRNTDYQVGRVLTRLQELNLIDQTLVIITADHGGHAMEHGTDRPDDMLIPWIIAAPGVIAGTVLGENIHITDTAATVLWALGLPLPDNMAGRPVVEAFAETTVGEMP